MSNNKYEDRVKQRSEEMAEIHNEDPTTSEKRFPHEFIPLARLSVRWEAEAFKEGFNCIYDFTDDPEFSPMITEGLIERGLIPPPNETT